MTSSDRLTPMMTSSLLRPAVRAVLGILLAANWPAAYQAKQAVDPLEGIAVEDLPNGETTYQPRRVMNPVVDIFLTAFMVRSVTGPRKLFLGVVLNGVGEDVLAPLVLSIDRASVSLPLREHPRIDASGCVPSATQTIKDDGGLVRKISRAKEVKVGYESPGIRLESTLTPADFTRFRRIIALYDMEDLPPAPKHADDPPQDPELSQEMPEGVSNPELIPETKVVPKYPGKAFEKHKSGRVVLRARILKDGTIGTLRPVSAYPIGCGFVESAIEAVKNWRYRPATKKGKPVEVDFLIMVEFDFLKSFPRVARAETPVVGLAPRGL